MPRPAASASAVARPAGAPGSEAPGTAFRPVAIGGLLVLAAVTLAHPSATRMHGWPLAAAVTGLCLLPALALLIGIWRSGTWRLPSTTLLAGTILLVLGAGVSAWLSPFSAASLPRLWPTLGGATLYLWLHHRWSVETPLGATRRESAARVLAGAGALIAVTSLALWSRGQWPLPWSDRNAVPFGHSTYTGGTMVLFLPWLGLQAWLTQGTRRLGWLAATAAAVMVLASTSSRGAVLALAFVGCAGAGVTVLIAPWSWRQKFLLAAGVLAVGAIVVLTNPRLRELVVHRQWGESSRESNAQRVAMLDAGWRLGLERPVTGWGPGTVPLAYPRVRAALDGGTENVLQLHNTPAQVWATTGVPGVAALALLVAGTLAALLRAPRTPVTFAAGASLVGYGIVALTDHQLDVPVFAATAATGLALLTAAAHPTSRRMIPTTALRAAACAPLGLLVLFTAPATWNDLHARQCYDAALTALGQGDGDGYLRQLDAATHAAPHDPFFAHRAAAWLLEQRSAEKEPARQAGLARDAVARLERSLATGAHEEFAHFNLGWLKLDLGDGAAAIRHFTRAAQLVPDKGGVYFGLGLAHEATGGRAAAIRAFALEWVNDPRTATAPAWEVPALAALVPAVRAEAIRVFNELGQRHPPAAAVGAWARWWWGEAIPAESLRPGFNAVSARFAAALPGLTTGEPSTAKPAVDPWAQACTAWREAGPPEAFLAVAGGEATFANALARRARQVRTDFRAFLASPTGAEPAFVRTYRRARAGYGVLALHPEGPPLADVHVVQENRVVADLAAGLWPVKGWLPGRFLLALLPADPR